VRSEGGGGWGGGEKALSPVIKPRTSNEKKNVIVSIDALREGPHVKRGTSPSCES